MLIIFDLDGTLVDSSKDLASAMNAMREHLGLDPLHPDLIYSFVGNGIRVLVERALGAGAGEDILHQGHQFFLRYYAAHATDHTRLYAGVLALLQRLSGQHKLAILTNKPYSISHRIVNELQICSYFQRIYGGDSFSSKKPDPVGIQTLMEEFQCPPSETLMIGDSSVDIATARNANVKSCGVLWGFQADSFHAHPPDFLVNEPAEIIRLIS